MNKGGLSQLTIEKIGCYVYLLIDPRKGAKNNGVFYVGKGTNNRAWEHLKDTHYEKKEHAKNERIREIRKSAGSPEPKVDILRHGLTREEAFMVEGAVIDYIGIENLTNKVLGHNSTDTGRMSSEEVEIKYQAKEAQFKDKVLLININKKFNRNMSPDEILKVTQGNWKISKKRMREFKVVCAVFKGIIREVFEIEKWAEIKEGKDKGRKYFIGRIAKNNIRNLYRHHHVRKYWKKGVQNPIRYSDSP